MRLALRAERAESLGRMTLFLVRHGRATAGIESLDPGLDDLGASQARHAAGALAAVGAGRLVCSPLRRTRETAAPIAAALGLTVEIQEAVSEVFNPSMGTDARGAMLGAFLLGRWSEQSAALVEWRDRVVHALVALGSAPTIVVSHFVAISAAIGAATQDDRVSPVAVPNASITTLNVVDARLVLRSAGSVQHLPEDEVTLRAAIPGR